MADNTKIEWTDATWNPIVGCSVVSPGCKRCYAMRFAGSRLQHVPAYAGLTQATKAGHVWTGEVRMQESVLEQPLAWRKGRCIFVNSMGDLFHEDVPDAWIDRVFDIMERAAQHIYQVLTKRAKRMREYMEKRYEGREPPRHIWLGVSAEDQERWDERVGQLKATPAAIRFVSVEPMLGPVEPKRFQELDCLDWIIVGGESGKDARPMHPAWARGLRDQCAVHGVPFFFKQHGEWREAEEDEIPNRFGRPCDDFRAISSCGFVGDLSIGSAFLHKPKSHPACFPNGDAGDAICNSVIVRRVGKKAAGRLLDGRTHDERPPFRLSSTQAFSPQELFS